MTLRPVDASGRLQAPKALPPSVMKSTAMKTDPVRAKSARTDGSPADAVNETRSRDSAQAMGQARLSGQSTMSAADTTSPESDERTPAPTFLAWSQRHARHMPFADFAVAAASGLLALALNSSAPIEGLPSLSAVIFFPIALLVSTSLGRCYAPQVAATPVEAQRLLSGVLRVAGVLGVVAFLASWTAAGPLLVMGIPLALAGVATVRLVAFLSLRRLRTRGAGRRRVVVVGTERAAAEMIRRLRGSSDHSFDVVGILTETSTGSVVEGVDVLGNVGSVRDAVVSTGATSVVVAPWSPISQEDVRRLSWETVDLGVELFLSPNVIDVAKSRMQIQSAAGLAFLHIDPPQFDGIIRMGHLWFDRCLALGGLVILAPMLAVIALSVRVSAPGRAIFRQERVGKGGKTFVLYKFRTMYVDSEARLDAVAHHNKHRQGPLFKAVEDPRVTRIGRLLRRFSLDELPQLLNVVKGDMALVGPRPPLPQEVAQYDDAALRRLLVRPGLTGLWQVSGRSDLPWEEAVRLDLYYVDNRTVASDVGILGRTCSAVLGGRGAY